MRLACRLPVQLPVLLALLAGALTTLATLAAPAAPALTAAPTVTLSRLTALPQGGGELVVHGVVGEADAAGLVLERWVGGQGWQRQPATLSSAGGRFHAVVQLDVAPLQQGGYFYLRGVLPAQGDRPATASEMLGVYVFPPADPPFAAAPVPTVSGVHAVGSTLRATAGSWSPTPAQVAFRWLRDGAPTGVTGPSYQLTADDLGRLVTVTAIAFPRSGSSLTYRDSRPAGPVARGAFVAPAPEIVGRTLAGSELRVELTGWSPTPTTVTYQWLRDGRPIPGATARTHEVEAPDAGTTLTVTVHAESPGVVPADVTSAPFDVPESATEGVRTFRDLMAPSSDVPWTAPQLLWTAGTAAPAWSGNERTRWDAPGAFTHSQRAVPAFTLASAIYGHPWANASYGAEYPGTNASVKNADVSFEVTGRRFAIAYRGTRAMDAMVWIDGRPIAAEPIPAQSPTTTGYAPNWIVVTLPERRTVRVRFAGPYTFTGVDAPAGEDVRVAAVEPPLTVGVISDSFFEVCSQTRCNSRSAAPMLGTLTGFRVWNLAESGTGYLAEPEGLSWGEYVTTAYGSQRHLDAIARAPIDVLLVNGSINDAAWSTYAPEVHRAAVDRFLTDVARVRPDLHVVLVGIEPLGIRLAPVWGERARAMTANLAAMVGRHPNVVGFIDPYTDPWLTGTGSITNPKGDGNQDDYIGLDGVHPSVAGIRYYVGRIAEQLAPLTLPSAGTDGLP